MKIAERSHAHNAGGFQTVAIVGFMSPLSVAVFGPACGRLLDLTPRRTALRFIISAQIGAIATAGMSLPSWIAGALMKEHVKC